MFRFIAVIVIAMLPVISVSTGTTTGSDQVFGPRDILDEEAPTGGTTFFADQGENFVKLDSDR